MDSFSQFRAGSGSKIDFGVIFIVIDYISEHNNLMLLKILHLVLLSLCALGAHSKPNLHIGTGGFGFGCGSNSPAAQVPYSFVRLGPDTSPM